MSFEVRDVHAAFEALRAEGVDCQSEPVPFDNSTAFDPRSRRASIEIIQWAADAAPYRIPA